MFEKQRSTDGTEERNELMESELKPIWIRQTDAPKMLGVSKYFFNLHLKPQLNPITLSSRCVVYDYLELQRFCGRVASANGWGEKGGNECPSLSQTHSSLSVAKKESGTSLDTSVAKGSDLVQRAVAKVKHI